MALGESTSNKIYLHITYGKLRYKTNESDPKAVQRENKEGAIVYERVFDFVDGLITGIYYKEDSKFGNSFEVTMKDVDEAYQVSLSEGDAFFQDFFSKAPNIDFSKDVKLVPYDFVDKKSGKRRRGLTVWQEDEKVENYFQEKQGDKWVYKHGFPEPDNPQDSDDWKMYFIKVTKFLRNYAKNDIIPRFSGKDSIEDAETIEDIKDNTDLPF